MKNPKKGRILLILGNLSPFLCLVFSFSTIAPSLFISFVIMVIMLMYNAERTRTLLPLIGLNLLLVASLTGSLLLQGFLYCRFVMSDDGVTLPLAIMTAAVSGTLASIAVLCRFVSILWRKVHPEQ